jgi:hypothetical protein
MPKDRNGNRLEVGDAVTIIPGMAVRQYGEGPPLVLGFISSINGEYIYLTMVDDEGISFEVERYGSELWKGIARDETRS